MDKEDTAYLYKMECYSARRKKEMGHLFIPIEQSVRSPDVWKDKVILKNQCEEWE